jgi:nanoRNase/pAp phosphatase (c-di-AMP/oligoRNAs hydrolase)
MKRAESLLGRKEESLFNVFKLRSMVRENDSLAVLMYGSPDPDAIASAMALQELLKQKSGLSKCVFVATEPVARQQNIEFLRAMKIDVQLLQKTDLHQYNLVAIVDAQPTFFGDALADIQPQIVLDHHPCTTVWHAELADIRKGYGALSTIMMEYLIVAKVKIPKKLYTALLYGIRTDTNNLERGVSLEDINAYYITFTRANLELIRRIEMNQIPDRFIKHFDHAYHHRKRYKDRIVCFIGKIESPDACVQVADFFLHLIDIYYVVIAGIVKDKLVVILRGDGYRQDCGAIAETAFGSFGKAGGHKSAARVEIPLESLEKIMPSDFTQEAIDQFLAQRLRGKRNAKNRIN